ncbi:acyltransferase family protein [Pedobacter ureilyticus]|uniref:Acyltransferase family protein n=1 Tax=Pedobacter ureilyticus TaxID=1393051 RepID=A0ABW9J4N5_9SPHI|nr:heparan-alpha-glucosaminide N-acetyltransferase domain-containing protein [Pedobacter helvus]
MEIKPTRSQRLLSLDFFRGLTVAAMILVNNPGSWTHIYPPLGHAEWHGCTPTDLVFPFFLFIVGVSIAYAMGSKREDQTTHGKTIWKASKRALTLFFLGFILAFFPRNFSDFNFIESLKTVRIPGVLQRIAVVFLISSILFLKLNDKRLFQTIVVLLFGYWALMNFVPVPDFGPANLEKETNLGAWLDRTILTEAHLWKSAKTWDPEGILSTLPAIGTCLIGVLVGTYLKKKNVEPATKIAWLFSAGTLMFIGGLIWDLQFPINKSLWTSSYVLYTGGLATVILSLSYWLIDVNQYNRFTKPFVVYGVNAITVFFLSGLMPRLLNMIKIDFEGEKIGALNYVNKAFFANSFANPLNGSLAYAIAFVLFWYVILWIMYKRNIIIKV